jgi:hypothetical protein
MKQSDHELELSSVPFKPVHEQKAVLYARAALSNKYSEGQSSCLGTGHVLREELLCPGRATFVAIPASGFPLADRSHAA